MPVQREIQIPQAMQRHTGCAWVHPTRAEANDEKEKTDTPKPDAAVRDSRVDLKPN
jgi:hypothetical protein